MADIIVESFEDHADGYDLAWTQTVGANDSVVTPSAEVAPPVAVGDSVLECNWVNTTNLIHIIHNHGDVHAITYARVYWKSPVDGVAWPAVSQNICNLLQSAGNDAWQIKMSSTDHQLVASFSTGGGLHDATFNVLHEKWYIFEMYYDATNHLANFRYKNVTDAGAFVYLHGTDATTHHAIAGAHVTGVQYAVLGQNGDRGFVGTMYYDLIKINDGDGWVGEESAGGNIIPVIIHHHLRH